jgi:hypothetical protein
MAHTLPFHSVGPGAPNVFHNSDACEAGRRVQRDCWRAGDGGHPLCTVCERLSQAARHPSPRPRGYSAVDRGRWRGVRSRQTPARRVMTTCPTTGKTVWTGLTMTGELLSALDGSSFHLWCPACRAQHPWVAAKAWIGPGEGEGGDGRVLSH